MEENFKNCEETFPLTGIIYWTDNKTRFIATKIYKEKLGFIQDNYDHN